ncbi:MAG: 1,4-alpha-glucan branching protein [Chitinophagia bacterium]|nr:1,4-alpha-glucan branching protein [Chitinophagia bacterium]
MKKEFGLVSWAINSNVYEVNTRQYTPEGNFREFLKHMPRLKEMGVEMLWFMPITPISLKNRKGNLGSYYACSSYREINPEFGNLDDFKNIVSTAHQNEMKVIIDWVANHTGCDHEWTNTYPAYYKIDHEGKFYDAHGWDDVIDLNYDNPELRIAMIEAMKYWVDECDIDGFRCDMAMLTPVDFWVQARTALEPVKKLFWLAELDPLDNLDYMQVFDSAYTWRWMNAAKHFKDEGARNIHSLREILHYYEHIPQNALAAWFTSNHDENSWNGTEYEKYAEMVLPLAVFSSTWKGLPLIYSGQELPNLKRLAFFDKDCIEWQKPVQLQEFYRLLLRLRKQHPCFIKNTDHTSFKLIRNNIEHHILSYKRQVDNHCCLVMINFSQYDLTNIEFEVDAPYADYTEIFSHEKRSIYAKHLCLDLKGWGYKVWVN